MSNGQYTADQTVDAKVMTRAVNKLERALFQATVKSKHSTQILDEALQSTSLQKLKDLRQRRFTKPRFSILYPFRGVPVKKITLYPII